MSAWTSGKLAFDTLDGKSSVASTLALHHIAAFLFEENSATDESFVRKIVKTLFDTSKQIPQRQVLSLTLISCSTPENLVRLTPKCLNGSSPHI